MGLTGALSGPTAQRAIESKRESQKAERARSEEEKATWRDMGVQTWGIQTVQAGHQSSVQGWHDDGG